MDNDYRVIDNYIRSGDKAHDEGNLIKALNYYLRAEELLGEEKDIDLIISIALMLDELGDTEKAKEKYEEALSINNCEFRAYYGLAVIYDEKENYRKAIELYKKAIDINSVYDRAIFFLANSLDNVGDKEGAIEYYKKTIEVCPEDFWAYTNLGSIYEEQDMLQEAYRMFSKALQIDGEHYLALFNMGVIYKRLNVYDKAKKFYEKSIKKNFGYAYTFLNLAVIYKEENNIEKGIDILSLGLRFNPENHFLYYNRSCFKAILGKDLDDATNDLIKAVELYPDFVKYINKDNDLIEVRNSNKFKGFLETLNIG
ncbi:tetratricopeptide repeat protein [Clostridium sp. LIBA-8841]|uniref:tetratricopeptide repeat protein n=1 Tax=Clostridium sp. LIBA-8841 TaxID=2987530 RepID=UPI002AC56B95|nr:tetratricopeptide repeat protein [Clostridium sp. LIBA-8841]MDZ5252933.1 tetratricopeptide repeat protein [Clostridium sp. LIBA-8841]